MQWVVPALLALLLAAVSWQSVELRELRSAVTAQFLLMDVRVRANTESAVRLSTVLEARGLLEWRSAVRERAAKAGE